MSSIARRKLPLVAFLLNFFLPGAGFVYLGKWLYAVANFLAVILIGILLWIVVPEPLMERIRHHVASGIAGGCGGLAMVSAQQWNKALDVP